MQEEEELSVVRFHFHPFSYLNSQLPVSAKIQILNYKFCKSKNAKERTTEKES